MYKPLFTAREIPPFHGRCWGCREIQLCWNAAAPAVFSAGVLVGTGIVTADADSWGDPGGSSRDKCQGSAAWRGFRSVRASAVPWLLRAELRHLQR